MPSEGAFTELSNTNGLNIFNGNVVAIRDGQFFAAGAGAGGGFCGAYRGQICLQYRGQGTGRKPRRLYQRRCVRDCDQDLAASAAAVSGEPGMDGDQRLDRWNRRPGNTVWRARFGRAGHSPPGGHRRWRFFPPRDSRSRRRLQKTRATFRWADERTYRRRSTTRCAEPRNSIRTLPSTLALGRWPEISAQRNCLPGCRRPIRRSFCSR
jgi:hypothetical protein